MEKHNKSAIHITPNGHFHFDKGNARRSVNNENEILTLDKSGKELGDKIDDSSLAKDLHHTSAKSKVLTLETVEEIEAFMEGEERSSVIEAAETRTAELAQ